MPFFSLVTFSILIKSRFASRSAFKPSKYACHISLSSSICISIGGIGKVRHFVKKSEISVMWFSQYDPVPLIKRSSLSFWSTNFISHLLFMNSFSSGRTIFFSDSNGLINENPSRATFAVKEKLISSIFTASSSNNLPS